MFDLPYGFYGFLRIAVCFSAMLVFARLHKSGHFVLCVIAAGMIILFNPVAPVHLSRENWFWLDLTAAGMFMAAGLWARHELRQPVKD